MGSIGTSAEKGRNTLCTWYDARQWIDNRFEVLRLQVTTQMSDSAPIAKVSFLRRLNLAWMRAVYRLDHSLLPQRRGRGSYNRVRTVHGGTKARPRNSRKLRAEVEGRRDRRGRTGLPIRARSRSHHVGEYPSGRGRGRPRLEGEARQRARQRWARKKAAKRRAANPPTRHYPIDRKSSRQPISKARRQPRSFITAARASVRVETKDKRKNHDTRYAYRSPVNRMRAANGQHSRAGIRGGRTAGNANAGIVLTVRRIAKDISRRRKLRAYWQKVRAAAARSR